MADTLTMDEPTRIYYAGVKAGNDSREQLADISGVPYATRLSYFWLKVGTLLAEVVPGGQDDLVTKFVEGATLAMPTPPALVLTIESTGGAAFGDTHDDDEGLGGSEDDARTEVARIVRNAAEQIHQGYAERPLLDALGNTVGRYALDLFSG